MSDQKIPLLAVCIRCAGIFMIVHAVASGAILYQFMGISSGHGALVFGSTALYVVAAIFFIVFAIPLANKCGPGGVDVGDDALLTGIRLIGLFYLVGALIDMGYNVFQLHYEDRTEPIARLSDLPSFPYIVSTAIKLFFGAIILLRSTKIAKWIRKR